MATHELIQLIKNTNKRMQAIEAHVTADLALTEVEEEEAAGGELKQSCTCMSEEQQNLAFTELQQKHKAEVLRYQQEIVDIKARHEREVRSLRELRSVDKSGTCGSSGSSSSSSVVDNGVYDDRKEDGGDDEVKFPTATERDGTSLHDNQDPVMKQEPMQEWKEEGAVKEEVIESVLSAAKRYPVLPFPKPEAMFVNADVSLAWSLLKSDTGLGDSLQDVKDVLNYAAPEAFIDYFEGSRKPEGLGKEDSAVFQAFRAESYAHFVKLDEFWHERVVVRGFENRLGVGNYTWRRLTAKDLCRQTRSAATPGRGMPVWFMREGHTFIVNGVLNTRYTDVNGKSQTFGAHGQATDDDSMAHTIVVRGGRGGKFYCMNQNDWMPNRMLQLDPRSGQPKTGIWVIGDEEEEVIIGYMKIITTVYVISAPRV